MNKGGELVINMSRNLGRWLEEAAMRDDPSSRSSKGG